MASDASDIISRLARMLFERRHQAIRPYTLVLGSDVLPIREMEDSVIRFSSGLEQARIDGLSPGARSESLRRAWQSVQSDQLAAVNLIDAALPLQNDKNPTLAVESIYAPLIGLIKRGYFTTIVSADFTTELEDTLVAEGMQLREFRVFANGRFNAAEVQQLLDRPHPAIRIIKVYGELHDKFAFTSDEKAAWTNEWRSGLERWLASPLLVVGYNPDCDQWPLTASTLLQYVNTALPARGTDVYRLLDARSLLDDCITGPEGVPGHFWSQLRIKIDALDKAQELGAKVDEMSTEQVEQALGGAAPLVDILSGWQQISNLVDVTEKATFCIRYEHDQSVSFNIQGAMSYASNSRQVIGLDRERLNRTLRRMGKNIATYYQTRDKEGHDDWREEAMDEGKLLYERLFAANPDLMERLGTARQVTGGAENLLLCFAGPRNHLGMPYELLYDREPLVVQHPVFRQINNVNAQTQTLNSLLPVLRRAKKALAILLIASDTDGIAAEAEVKQLKQEIEEKSHALRIHTNVTTMLTDSATLPAVEKALTKCPYHIVHFAGHGSFDPATGENSGLVLWGGPKRSQQTDTLTARALAQILKGGQTVLFYLSSCVGATVGDDIVLNNNDYLGVMDAVVQAGIPTVLGFRWYVTDAGARLFASRFYQALFETQSAPQAAFQARRFVYKQDATDETWTSPILVAQSI